MILYTVKSFNDYVLNVPRVNPISNNRDVFVQVRHFVSSLSLIKITGAVMAQMVLRDIVTTVTSRSRGLVTFHYIESFLYTPKRRDN
jgi:hypothetical protein